MSEDHPGPEPSVTIDLSRRKSGRAGPAVTDPSGVLRRDHPGLDVVRQSFESAGRAASPYLTMTRIALRRLERDRLARAGGLVLATLALVAVFADVLASELPLACRWQGVVYFMPAVVRPAPLAGLDCDRMRAGRSPGDWAIEPLVAFGPSAERVADALLSPLKRGHPFGTDASGRDVFARVVHGTRLALGAGLAAATILVAIGATLGALAGFAGGVVDGLVTRLVESLTAIPTIVLVLVVGALVPHPTTVTLLLTIALTRWTEPARIVRVEILQTLRTDYVTAARALGASERRVLWRHALPNAIAPTIVAATFALAWVVLTEATVDFLRVGAVETTPSWGEVLGEARANAHAWWLIAFPGAMLLATLVSLLLVGEAGRNALDPRLRGAEAAP